jgi:hypothetical protein
MGHLEGKSGHQHKAGTWGFVDCILACSPWVAQFAFFISHSITSIEIKNMLKGLAYRQSDRGIFSVEVTSSQDGSSLCQVHKKQTQQTGILSHILQ